MPDRIYDPGIACRLRCVFYFQPCSLDRICNSSFLFNPHPLIFYKANKSRESIITVAQIYYIYTDICIFVNGFILYVVWSGVQGLLDCARPPRLPSAMSSSALSVRPSSLKLRRTSRRGRLRAKQTCFIDTIKSAVAAYIMTR